MAFLSNHPHFTLFFEPKKAVIHHHKASCDCPGDGVDRVALQRMLYGVFDLAKAGFMHQRRVRPA